MATTDVSPGNADKSMTDFEPDRHLSRRTAAVEEAAILRMAQATRDLRAQGHDVVNLTVGEPDFDTPAHIRRAATAAIEAGYTHYAPVAGYPEVRQAIADKLRSENGLDYTAGEIALANGGKQAITNAAFALLDPGDEVIFLAPYWIAYEGIVRMAGARPVVLQAGIEDGFKVPVERLAEVLSERSKLLFLNSPCNPSGAVWSRADLEALADMVCRHPRLFVIADEIYEYIVFDGEPVSFASLPGMKARTVTINGFSKAFAMTGWRLGYGAAPEPVARAMSKVQGTFTAGANAFVQQAGIAALQGGRAEVETMRATYRRRRDETLRRLGATRGLRVAVPAGTFYVFPDVSAFLGRSAGNHRIDTVDVLCDWLLTEHLVSTVPGTAFGNGRCIRLSFAASDADLAKGLDRFGAALESLKA
jgi:aspartate aminotransferase